MSRVEPMLSESPVLPEETALEIDNFEAEMNRFLGGQLSPERWRAFRLSHGIYGQRQPGVQMVRVKIPTGGLNGRQLSRLADISERFASGLLHLTTRQDVQFHFLKLERVPHVMRLLAEVGLTTREACGNSVRNVTACPLSGFIGEELFEVRPYALATYAFLVRNPFCQQMARKFKIAFSACPEDCAATAIHDIGAVGRVEKQEGERDGERRFGFKILVGGGLGSTPFTAETLDEFVPLEELLPTIKAIVKVFTDHGNRQNKMKARIKFVVHKLGIEKVRELVAVKRHEMTEEEHRQADLDRYVPEELRDIVARHLGAGRSDSRRPDSGKPLALRLPLGNGKHAIPMEPAGRNEIVANPCAAIKAVTSVGPVLGRTEAGAAPLPSIEPADPSHPEAFRRWLSFNVRRHKDPERAVVTVLFPLGDLEAPRVRELAGLLTAYGEDHARVARDQNLVLPSVNRRDLPRLYEGLATAGLAEAGIGTALDVTACPGADTCGLGITSSKGLTRAIRSELSGMAGNGGLDRLRGVTIKISGCPNACAQHHIANIGLHGVSKWIGGKQVPAYQLHLGGSIGNGEARIGEVVEKIPARNVPKAVAALLRLYETERAVDESFADFAARVGRETLARTLDPFVHELPREEQLVVDWGQQDPFSTEDIGVGECAGAGTDAAVGPFDNYEAEIHQASLFMEREQWADALANLNRSQYSLARILLERLGKRPESDYECACEIRAQVIDRGYGSELWNEIHHEIERLMRTKTPDPRAVLDVHRRSLDLLEESKRTLPILERRKATMTAEIPG